jgi:hypothetical protein
MRSRILLASLFVSLLSAACGSSSPPPTGKACSVNSDCNNPLSCTFGSCHEACAKSTDCPTGQTCVKGPINPATMMPANVCQLPADKTCAYNSDCMSPLVCARDLHCRNQCQTDVDCISGQMCAAGDKVCADPPDLMSGMLKNTIDGSIPQQRPLDGGSAGGDAGVSSDDVGGSSSDVPVSDGGGGGPDVNTTPLTVEITSDKPTVRQGDLVTITVTGPNVAMPMNLDAGGFTVALQPGGTDTMFKASVAIPHGAALGPKDFKFTTAGGLGQKTGVFTVTAITAGPMGDDTATGTTDKPFKTFTKAITVASAGDTVSLLDGKYSMGETWMKPIPDKITIVGTSTDGTVLEGPGAMGGGASVDGLSFAGDGTVKNVTVGYFNYDFHISKPGTITLDNVKAVGARYDGIYVDSSAMGAKISVTGTSDLSGNSQSSLQIANATGVSFSASGMIKLGSMTSYTIVVSGMNNSVSLDGATISDPSNYAAIYANGVGTAIKLSKTTMDNFIQFSSGSMPSGSLDIIDSTLTFKMGQYGVQFTGATLNISGTTMTGGSQQVVQYGGAAKIRTSKFMNYASHGYYIQTGTLDLGTAADPGTNSFDGPDMPYIYGLYDARQLAMAPITCSFTTFNGLRPDAGVVTNMAMSPVNVAGKYFIQTVGNSIQFF